METLWHALQQSAFAGAIRQSEFIYPTANVMHVVAVIMFYGLVATMDLQILTRSGSAALVQRLRPFALAMLAIVAMAGFILFAADAVAIAANMAFRLKLLLILLASINLAVHLSTERERVRRVTAAVSLMVWLAVAAFGRFIAYV